MTNSTIHQLSPQALNDKLNRHEDILLMDIRDASSYKSDHITGAIHITSENLAEFVQQTPKVQTIVIYCYKGIASQQAARYLQGIGYTNLYNLIGGYQAWLAMDST